VLDLPSRIARAQVVLEELRGRSPRPREVAAHLGEELDDVVEALAADGCFTPTSLDGPVGDGSSTLGDLIGMDDRSVVAAEARVVLAPVLRKLTPRDQQILQLRFVEERTQQEIAEAIGLTQAQVSRVLTRILADLRGDLAARPSEDWASAG
jgi:RNA polymerase sigma-B factor